MTWLALLPREQIQHVAAGMIVENPDDIRKHMSLPAQITQLDGPGC